MGCTLPTAKPSRHEARALFGRATGKERRPLPKNLPIRVPATLRWKVTGGPSTVEKRGTKALHKRQYRSKIAQLQGISQKLGEAQITGQIGTKSAGPKCDMLERFAPGDGIKEQEQRQWDIRSRFLSEGYAANNIDHPGVVRVLDDATAEDGSTYLVMELLEGTTLEQRAISAGGRLPLDDVLALGHQLLDVLAVAHDKGVIHRDVKPENLFLTSQGQLKILDFGIARMNDPAAAHATVTGQVFGTPAFLPPEQALGEASKIDPRTDLWAVGATMFTLLTGEYVYGETTPARLIAMAATAPARPIRSVMPALPSPVADVIDRALQRERERRWGSAREMQAALVSAAGRASRATTAVAIGAVDASHVSERSRLVAWIVIALAGAGTAATLVVLLLWLAFGASSDPAPEPVLDATTPAVSLETTWMAEPPAPEDSTAPTASSVPSSSVPPPPPKPRSVPRRTPPRTTGAFDYQ